MNLRIRIPEYEGDDLSADGFVHVDLPGVPRVGDSVVHSAVVHRVEDVIWDTDGRVKVYLGGPVSAVIG